MSGLHFDSLDDCPPGLRKLLEKQAAKEKGIPTGKTPSGLRPPPSEREATGNRNVGSYLQQEKEPKRKYRNTPTERLLPNGECIKFGSKKEAAYYDNLILLEKVGTVRNIKLQYQYLLKPAYTDAYTGERFRAISYLADFVFERLEDGKWREVVIDTKGGGRKGTETKTFILKRKLLAEQGVIIETA